MRKQYIVRLREEERQELTALVSSGKAAAYKIRHAHILLKVDADGPAWPDEQVAEAFSCHRHTVSNVRQRFVEHGLEAALERKRRETPPRRPVCDGEAEAKLIALRCGQPPQGYGRWTLKLLADKAVELEIVASISYETVRQVLKKTTSSPTCASNT